MDSSAQIILALSQQNIKLMEEIASLKAELAKVQINSAPKTKKNTKKQVDESIPPKPKNPARVENGKKLAAWNAARKAAYKAIFEEFKDSAKIDGEW